MVPRESRPYVGCDFFITERSDSMRKFEKITFEQFKKDIADDKELYEEYSLPKRETKYAAAYSLEDLRC